MEGFVHSEVLRLRVSVVRIILPESSCGARSRFLSPSGCGTTAGPCAGRLRNGSKNDRAGYLFARMQGRRIFCPVRPLRRLSTAGQTGESIVPELSQPLCQPDFYRDITTVFVGVFSARVGSFWSFARIYIALCRTVRTNKSFRSERLRRIFAGGHTRFRRHRRSIEGNYRRTGSGCIEAGSQIQAGGKRNPPFPPCL